METQSKKVVLVGGCFDILHYGHVEFLRQARELGSSLTILLETDSRIKLLKGYSRPFHTQIVRKKMLEALRYVDTVILLPEDMTHEKYAQVVSDIHPSIIAITTGDPILERKYELAKSVGATLITIPHINAPSTTDIATMLGLE
jgi:rfaE bifunctional protein nucleotidyltransferase chain/domain